MLIKIILIFAPGKIELYGQEFYCWKDGGHGRINLKDAIKKSCDIYFYEVARLLGVDRLAETIRKFNFGQTTLKDFDEERKGLVPDTKWKKNVLGKPWLLRRNFNYRNRTRLYISNPNANLQINGTICKWRLCS